MCVYVRERVCLYACALACVCMCVFVYLHVLMYLYLNVCVSVSVRICLYCMKLLVYLSDLFFEFKSLRAGNKPCE